MYVTRFTYFTPDGVSCLNASIAWEGDPALPEIPPFSNDDYPVTYAVPMDDDPEHWHRMEAEIYVQWHPDPKLRPHGHARKLRHAGGTPHPAHPHVRQGGTLLWDGDPHPAVQERMASLHSIDLYAHLTGTARTGGS